MKPLIAVTMGDPGGIGPEVTLKALARQDVSDQLDAVVVGDVEVLQAMAKRLHLKLRIRAIDKLEEVNRDGAGTIVNVCQSFTSSTGFASGRVSAENGRASHSYIVTAARAALSKHIDAVCTAPIAKEALFEAGYEVPGHTELLAQTCGLESVRMMLVGGGLRVVLQSIHVALSDVPALVTREGIAESLRMITAFAAGTGNHFPRIAVCGLNPHAGENGHFGTEEQDIIEPAVNAAIVEGMQVNGPIPADTVFHRARQGEFDFVLAMYHDQGLIPVKTLDFHGGVNVTLGLPLLRTSPDHGTAFNLAGLGIADEGSMVSALKYAAGLVRGQL